MCVSTPSTTTQTWLSTSVEYLRPFLVKAVLDYPEYCDNEWQFIPHRLCEQSELLWRWRQNPPLWPLSTCPKCHFPLKGQYRQAQSRLSTGHGIGVLAATTLYMYDLIMWDIIFRHRVYLKLNLHLFLHLFYICFVSFVLHPTLYMYDLIMWDIIFRHRVYLKLNVLLWFHSMWIVMIVSLSLSIRGQYLFFMINRAWNRGASFRLTHWLKITRNKVILPFLLLKISQ